MDGVGRKFSKKSKLFGLLLGDSEDHKGRRNKMDYVLILIIFSKSGLGKVTTIEGFGAGSF